MKKVYILIGFIAAFSMFMFGTKAVLADDPSFGLNKTAETAGLAKYGNSVPTIAGNIIGTLLSMISVLFFVLILYGGVLWMTARGSSETTEKALNTIIAATIGIIIIIGAYALTNFVFKLGQVSDNSGTETTKTIYCEYFDEGTNKCKALTVPINISESELVDREIQENCIDRHETAAACEASVSN